MNDSRGEIIGHIIESSFRMPKRAREAVSAKRKAKVDPMFIAKFIDEKPLISKKGFRA